MENGLSMNDKKTWLVQLGLILIILGTSVMVFASLAEDVVNHEELSTLDPILGNRIITSTSQSGDRFFSLITSWGDTLVFIVGTALIGMWLMRRKSWDRMIFLYVDVGGAALLNLILKQIFVRPRPDYPLAYLTAPGFSFPSGHAMISVAFYGAIAYLSFAYLKRFRAKVLVSIGTLVISGFIGYSRVYLGVHYVTDVLAGWAAGTAWLAVCILVDQLHLHSEGRKKWESGKILGDQ